MIRTAAVLTLIAGGLLAADLPACRAGMPALLPTKWTADSEPPAWASHSASAGTQARWQAISFFMACLLGSAWGLKLLWNFLRGEFTALPRIGYGRALSLVVLWGLCFVVVLTMISGARELMTPGAWRKQGWTYTLAPPAPENAVQQRKQALERLRFALWNHAAAHGGRFPSEGDSSVEDELWGIPGWAGLRFLYVAGRSVETAGRVLAFEPDLGDGERFVLLTNGFIGTMRTTEIDRLLADTTP